VKSELLKDVGMIQHDSEALETSSFSIKLTEMSLFMCDARTVDEKRCKSIKKRRIFEISSMKVMMRTLMEFDKLTKIFSTSNTITLDGKQVFIVISYKDIVSLASSLTHNIKMLDREYCSCIEKHDKGIFTRLDSNGPTDNFNTSYVESFSKLPRQGGYIPSHRDDNIESVIKRMTEAVAHIKKVLKGLAQYRANTTACLIKLPKFNKNLTQLKKQKTNTQFFEVTGGYPFEKQASMQKKEELANSGSFRRSSILPSNKDSMSTLGEHNTLTKITFQNIKIVLSCITLSYSSMIIRVSFIPY
jgi:hypothetical protein